MLGVCDHEEHERFRICMGEIALERKALLADFTLIHFPVVRLRVPVLLVVPMLAHASKVAPEAALSSGSVVEIVHK